MTAGKEMAAIFEPLQRAVTDAQVIASVETFLAGALIEDQWQEQVAALETALHHMGD